jgi:hypothetical protein
MPEFDLIGNYQDTYAITGERCNDIGPDQELSFIDSICEFPALQTKEKHRSKLHSSDQAERTAIVIGEFEDQPILRNSLRPGSDIGESVCWKEDSEIAVAK